MIPLNEFMNLVGAMRRAQRTYYTVRTQENLLIAKQYEKRVDRAVEDYFEETPKQIFDLGN